MGDGKTTDELMSDLGVQLRAQRLRMNLTLAEVSKIAGVSINALRRLESGDGTALYSFVAVLRALRRDDWLATLQPPVTINPLSMLNRRAPRQRAYKPRNKPQK